MAARKKKPNFTAKRNAPKVLSESAALTAIREHAETLADIAVTMPKGDLRNRIATESHRIYQVANGLAMQLKKGVHANPPLTVFALANPPRGGKQISKQLYTIKYQHSGNGKNYFHDFKPGTQMFAMPDGSICIRRPGGKVWGDYPAE